jgi:tRNA uridine 5-carbamoylmethylation protein Kti12
MPGIHINPDHFLQTDAGRVFTSELNVEAWKRSYEALTVALLNATAAATIYVLVGPQGSGKSTWARTLVENDEQAIVFDAILVKQSEREPILRAARARQVPSIAVWFRTPLETCLARNAARPQDEVVPERGVRNVHAAVEPPTTDEGFHSILEVFPSERSELFVTS